MPEFVACHMKGVVSEKGRVTIPKPLRERLGFGPGTELEFEEEDGRLVAHRVFERDPLSALLALLPRMNVDASLTRLRGPKWSRSLDETQSGHRQR